MYVRYLIATRTTDSCGGYLLDECDIEKLLQFICDTPSIRHLYLLV